MIYTQHVSRHNKGRMDNDYVEKRLNEIANKGKILHIIPVDFFHGCVACFLVIWDDGK